jgi:hypothetical protein
MATLWSGSVLVTLMLMPGDTHSMRQDWRHVPAASRLAAGNAHYGSVVERHDASLAAGLPTYADPVSGFSVFTADFLAARGDCCDSGCRHCPFVD